MIDSIIIQSDGWSENEIKEISQILDHEKISNRKLAQFDCGLSFAIVVVVSMFGGAIITGIGNSIGADVWKGLKDKFSKKVKEGKSSSISFVFKNERYSSSFNIKTENEEVLEKAFDTIDSAFENISEEKTSFYFEPKTTKWVKTIKSDFVKEITGIAATTDKVIQGGKPFQFSEDALKDASKKLVGLPLTIDHGGKQIGEITSSWYENGQLKYKAGIYNTTSEEDMKTFNTIKHFAVKK